MHSMLLEVSLSNVSSNAKGLTIDGLQGLLVGAVLQRLHVSLQDQWQCPRGCQLHVPVDVAPRQRGLLALSLPE